MEGEPSTASDPERIESEDNLVETDGPPPGCFNWFCHPVGRCHRFIALIFMCFLGFGSYFCYDNPAALIDYIKRDLNITNAEYSVLYSIYSWPNVVLCFVGGFLIDSVFGIRLGAIIYSAFTLGGHTVFALGAFCEAYWLMVLGRFIFGIGGESLAVAQNNYAVLWFSGKELNMVFGLQLSFSRVGSTANLLVMEPLYKWVQGMDVSGHKVLGIVLFIAGITCIFSFICGLVLGALDKRAERILSRNNNTSGEVVRLSDVKNFKGTFWLITVICVTYYVAIFPFVTYAKEFFKERFHISSEEANQVSSFIYTVSMVASPVLGFLIDLTGRNITWLLGAIPVTMLSHVLLAFTLVNPYVGVVIMGIAYSALASSLWPLVSLIIPDYQLGTAYGVCQAIQNLGLAVINIITGVIVDKFGFVALEIFFLCCLSAALLSTIGMAVMDKIQNGTLNMSRAQRQRHHQSIM
nr:unnamed protein product [Callosobruchus chinensis]